MIILENVHFTYDGIYTALRGVSLQIDDGERVAIMGANGAGKTTLLKHFNGLLRPESGNVFLDGRNTRRMSVAQLAKSVGLVFQNPDHQLFLESVRKEIEFGLKNMGSDDETASQVCSRTLSELGLEGLADRSPFALSGGERKRVALASVLATAPRILALDEPTIGQDAKQKKRLADLLMEMNEEGKTVICVTHDIEFVTEYFPRTVAMANGEVVADGPTNSVLSINEVLDRCALTLPQVTLAARELKRHFSEVNERTTLVSELESSIMEILEG